MKNLQNFELFLNEGFNKTDITSMLSTNSDSEPGVYFNMRDYNGTKTATIKIEDFFYDDEILPNVITDKNKSEKFLKELRRNFKKAWFETIEKYEK